MRITNLFIVLLCLMPLCITADFCVKSTDLRFKSQNGRLEVNNQAITIKGINWWGIETSTLTLGGLQAQPMTYYLDQLKANGFNGLRIPFSLDMMLNPLKRFPRAINTQLNPDLANLPSVEIIDRLFQAAADRGILILLDQHKFDISEYNSAPAWFTWLDTPDCITNLDGVCKTYYIEDSIAGWNYTVGRFKKYWNFFAIDLLNEPHSWIRWGHPNPNVDWAQAAAQISNSVISTHPDWHGLFFVEGIERNPQCELTGCPDDTCVNDGHWWGGNLEGLRCADVMLTDMSRLVYSPHVYSSSVFDQSYFNAADFPHNLPTIFDTHFGFAINQTGRAIVMGEWGGPLTGKDLIIQNSQAAYFANNGIDSTFYWALNPNPGGDTDGLFNPDWTTLNMPKVQFLANAHPTPTRFYQNGTNVCVITTPYINPTYPPTQPPPTPRPGAGASDPSHIKITVNGGTNKFWIGFAVSNDGGLTVKAEVRDSKTYSTWQTCSLTSYGQWIFSPASGELTLPIDVRVTSSTGVLVEADGIIISLSDYSLLDMGASYILPTQPPTQAPTQPPPTQAPPTQAPTLPPTIPPTVPATKAPTTRPATPKPATPKPATPAPATPAPTQPPTIPPTVPATPIPATAIPATPKPATPAPATPVPVTPTPAATPIPATSIPATPIPATIAPTPIPATIAPTVAPTIPATPLPATPIPATPVPATPIPATPIPATSIPATPVPATPIPATPIPATPIPATPIPATPIPATPKPATPIPATPTPATPSPSTPVPPKDTLKAQLNSGVSAYWFALQIQGGGKDTVRLELQDGGAVSSWSPFSKQNWGVTVFVYQPGTALVLPLRIRATSATGSQITFSVPNFNGGTTIDSMAAYSS